MARLTHRELLTRMFLLLMSTSAIILVSEITLRALSPSANKYYAHRPYFRTTFDPSPEIMPGVKGESRYIVNSDGMRGDELSNDHTYRILVIGGSTTECHYLDQSETWTCLLQKKLNEKAIDHNVWTGNVARGGITTRHHIIQMKCLLKQYPNIDAIIMLVGINDLSRRLSEDERYDPDFLNRPGYEEELQMLAFSISPVKCSLIKPYYKRTALWYLARKFRYRFFSYGQIQDSEGRYLINWRNHRQNALAIRRALPDLTSALNEYSRNLNIIIDLAEERSVRLIMLTQPTIWRADLPKRLRDLLWFGIVGRFRQGHRREYYSVEALAEGMRMYNETLIRTCRVRGAEYLDLASFLQRDTTVFYDDCHFNECGADSVAEAITRYMLQKRPFKEQTSDISEVRKTI